MIAKGPNGSLAGLLMSARETLTFLEENKLEVRARITINAPITCDLNLTTRMVL